MASFIRSLSIEEKLDILTESARYDVCLASCNSRAGGGGSGRVRDPLSPLNRWIYPASLPGGGMVHMLKVLMSNVCVNNCRYCFFAAERNCGRRTSFRPEELAAVFMQFFRAGEVSGLFLSSGVRGGAEETMKDMVKTAALLRERYRFRGYIHLKVLPGVSADLVSQAVRLSNRISINLEAPSGDYLARIAPEKGFRHDLMERMDWTGRLIRQGKGSAASQTTQFVVGPSGESDLDIMRTVDWIYRERYVFRSYFSAFQNPDEPVAQGGLERDSLLREHRLYQCDFLLRAYGFRLPDLVFDGEGKVPLQTDPKTAWALMNGGYFPVDINSADENRLLRVPGIGPLSASRIIAWRKDTPFRTLEDLKKTGCVVSRAASFIEFSGKKSQEEQLYLFDAEPPSGWREGVEPWQKEKLRQGYEYPAQRGKTVNYLFKGKNTAPFTAGEISVSDLLRFVLFGEPVEQGLHSIVKGVGSLLHNKLQSQGFCGHHAVIENAFLHGNDQGGGAEIALIYDTEQAVITQMCRVSHGHEKAVFICRYIHRGFVGSESQVLLMNMEGRFFRQ